MTPEQMVVGGVIAVMLLFLTVLGGVAFYTRDRRN